MIKENYLEVLNLYKYFVSALYSVTWILEIVIFHEIEVYIERVKWTRSASPGQLNVWINRLLRGIPSHTIWLGCYFLFILSSISFIYWLYRHQQTLSCLISWGFFSRWSYCVLWHYHLPKAYQSQGSLKLTLWIPTMSFNATCENMIL